MATGKSKPDDLDFIENAVNQLENATNHGVNIGHGKLLKVRLEKKIDSSNLIESGYFLSNFTYTL